MIWENMFMTYSGQFPPTQLIQKKKHSANFSHFHKVLVHSLFGQYKKDIFVQEYNCILLKCISFLI